MKTASSDLKRPALAAGVCGYIAGGKLLRSLNPRLRVARPPVITADDLQNFWRSDCYGSRAKAVLSRPAFVMEKPKSHAQQPAEFQ